jgi:hydrogenase nickel incorporation protein HypB
MCDSCGCGDTNLVPVEVQQRILSDNERMAAHHSPHFVERPLLAARGPGLVGPGRRIGRERLPSWPVPLIGALAGDLATDNDALRLNAAVLRADSITTGFSSDSDAGMVHHALHHLPWSDLDYLFIENVGNLVCPAVYDLGQAANVVLLAVTEGEDKPLKYPVMFHKADLVLISKVDLLPYLPDISLDRIVDSLRRVMPDPKFIATSARTGQGIGQWIAWLREQERSEQQTHPEHQAHRDHSHA